MIARGKPEEVLPAVAKSVGATAIYAHADVRRPPWVFSLARRISPASCQGRPRARARCPGDLP